jgi:hypothetical protein
MANGRTISDADRVRARRRAINESGRTISDADRQLEKEIERMLNESSRTISNEDRARVEEITEEYEKYLKRNDGGMAMSGRGKPVRTF